MFSFIKIAFPILIMQLVSCFMQKLIKITKIRFGMYRSKSGLKNCLIKKIYKLESVLWLVLLGYGKFMILLIMTFVAVC